MDEREAIIRLKEGDIEALEVIVQKYQVQAIRSAYLITKQAQMAEDIVQTAFIRAYERIQQYRGQGPSDFGAWFGRIVVTQSLNAINNRHQAVSLTDNDGEDEYQLMERLAGVDLDPLEEVMKAETVREIDEALALLSSDQRSVILLRYFLELTEADMAERLACPPGTIKWRLHSARKSLRTVLKAIAGSATIA